MSPMSVFLNLYGNIIAFIPFGMLLRWARNKNTTFVQALLYSLGFTLVIETVQYITKLGVFDIDDIIMNTLGGVIGYCIYYVTANLSGDIMQRSKEFKVSTPGSADGHHNWILLADLAECLWSYPS